MVMAGRRAARAILIDDSGRLLLIKRMKPGQAPYWTPPGGGVEDTDASVKAALYQELAEEPEVEATDAPQVFMFGSPSEAGLAMQHFLRDMSGRPGRIGPKRPEFSDPSRGGYELDQVDPHEDDLAAID
ncbi:NUDIX domain-containing protein [Actinosynnema sp. NPDC023587]|uniref:NUDIX domain-containing protein n=1 Tax=Actinosynnema sp. NPDC023587 TaxID=3154695 RepID=UPI0033EB35FC